MCIASESFKSTKNETKGRFETTYEFINTVCAKNKSTFYSRLDLKSCNRDSNDFFLCFCNDFWDMSPTVMIVVQKRSNPAFLALEITLK